MLLGWDAWKKGFDAWENATAALLEQWLRSPLVMGPSGALLTATMKVKVAMDEAMARGWGMLGLPTKRDQERTLYLLGQLEGRLGDLEDKLEG